jgi:hypothetical protein
MRAKTIFLIIAIVLVAAFAALNLDEFTRVSTLSLGVTTIQVALGLVMLVLLIASLLVFLASTIYMQSTHMIEVRKYARDLTAQRELADRAEASRYTELRTYIESQANAAVHREAANATVISERLAQTQAAVLHRLEQSDNTAAAYFGQLEDRMERRQGPADSGLSGTQPLI